MHLSKQIGVTGIREARANLPQLLQADRATVLTSQKRPTGILVPIDKHTDYSKGSIWKARAKARQAFQKAVILAFGGSGHAH